MKNKATQLKIAYTKLVEPHAPSLPNKFVLLVPFATLLSFFILFVSFGFTGSSTGMLHQFFGTGEDPRLLFGEPRGIRSDEWLVQSSWVISQVQQGLPAINLTFPGGMDATVQHDLPATDWSIVFRPHLWGFYFLPLDQAAAFKWWMPIFSMIGSAYLFFISVSPSRMIFSATLALAVFFQPFTQWWELSATFWPIAWGFLVMGTVVLSLRRARLTTVLVLASLSGFITVTTGITIYAPFIISVAFVVLAFGLGFTLDWSVETEQEKLSKRLRRLLPLLIAGLLGLFFLGAWVMTRLNTIQGFLNTVYPGERLVATGSADISSWITLFSAPFSLSIYSGETLGALGVNSSEASTFFLVGLFTIVPLSWLAIKRFIVGRKVDSPLLAMLLLLIFVVTFLAVPGWDKVAHLLFIDRVPVTRLRLLFGIAGFAIIGLLTTRADQVRAGIYDAGLARLPRWPAVLAAFSALLSSAFVWFWIIDHGVELQVSVLPIAVVVLLTGGLCIANALSVWFFSTAKFSAGAIVFLLCSGLTTIMVNPLYIGYYDLNKTEIAQELKRIDSTSSVPTPLWVGVGDSFLPGVLLVQSGLSAVNGFQTAPPKDMWGLIDPEKTYEEKWNRLGNVFWAAGEGRPTPSNPYPDQIKMTFDSCYSFAQNNVKFVLSDRPLSQNCISEVTAVSQGPTTFHIYRVHPRQ